MGKSEGEMMGSPTEVKFNEDGGERDVMVCST